MSLISKTNACLYGIYLSLLTLLLDSGDGFLRNSITWKLQIHHELNVKSPSTVSISLWEIYIVCVNHLSHWFFSMASVKHNEDHLEFPFVVLWSQLLWKQAESCHRMGKELIFTFFRIFKTFFLLSFPLWSFEAFCIKL